ncbi:hypothetical protein T12_346 [Trichinella patagoniensis]|uniref:Uncharacterized protein n=2 Tax=Trichinella TaxID=6333 RepID=A0A0V0ZGT4_9BILA|nr:hypothetical protein T05_974 [Trichinella murrelli]KRX58187.1 hypothetical protein T09_6643 [Trichinella sp. T9]KRY11720.1 hypothetical protein T12_346 [Trichinella patagoniensis]KRZ94233.1 hypothetical protein T08_1557 [Trichinella sp. T8]
MLFQLKNNGLSKKPPIELAKNNHRPNYVNLHKMNLGRRRNVSSNFLTLPSQTDVSSSSKLMMIDEQLLQSSCVSNSSSRSRNNSRRNSKSSNNSNENRPS